MIFVPHDWRLALATVLLAGLIDVVLGEPPSALHPVVWMGKLIGALERRRPRGRPGAELAYGVFIVLVTAGAAFAAGLVLTLVLDRLPWWLALPIGAYALKTAFSLRGLVRAGRDVQRALVSGADEARAQLRALVSRSPDLDPPLIVSATVESLAENLTDSVVSPLLYYALFGLPGAFAYRAINTMDAMLGYRDDREYVGKTAARSDDVANWVPTRITGLLLVTVSALKGTAGRAWWAFRTQHQPQYGPNKTLAIATMAGSLGVQLQKPAAYALGRADRPLTADVIDDAVWRVWAAGGATVALAAGLAALLTWAVWAHLARLPPGRMYCPCIRRPVIGHFTSVGRLSAGRVSAPFNEVIHVCRNIKPLFNYEPPATGEEIRAAALQYVRKISGSTHPSAANQEAFDRAVDEVTRASTTLLASLVTTAPPRDRDVDAARARTRAARRYGAQAG